MTLKDLTDYFDPPLRLPYGGKDYVVQPPTKDAGLKLAAINAAGVATYAAFQEKCPTCGRAGSPDLPQSTRDLLESIQDVQVAALSLGQDVYDEMIADGVPGPHLDTMGMYALYYWVLGEQTADAIMAAQHHGGDASGEAAPATGRTSTPKGGRRTASANRTSGASTRRTAARRQP